MDWNSYFLGVITVFIVALIMVSFGAAHIGANSSTNGNAVSEEDSGMPEKCKVPAGQDINSWKEHLGHHAETQECLKYFD